MLTSEKWEAIRYLIFGAMTVVVSLGSYSIMVLLGLNPAMSNIASWCFAVVFAFVTNKFWVFRSRDTDSKTIGRESTTFLISRIITGLVSWIGFPLLVAIGLSQSIFGIDCALAKGVVTLTEIVLNYVFSKYLIFHIRFRNKNDQKY